MTARPHVSATTRPTLRFPVPWALALPSVSFLAVTFVWPIMRTIGSSFTGTGSVTTENYRALVSDPYYARVGSPPR